MATRSPALPYHAAAALTLHAAHWFSWQTPSQPVTYPAPRDQTVPGGRRLGAREQARPIGNHSASLWQPMGEEEDGLQTMAPGTGSTAAGRLLVAQLEGGTLQGRFCSHFRSRPRPRSSSTNGFSVVPRSAPVGSFCFAPVIREWETSMRAKKGKRLDFHVPSQPFSSITPLFFIPRSMEKKILLEEFFSPRKRRAGFLDR